MLHTNYFAYGIHQSIGDTAITYGLTAARWGVLGWEWYTDTFFSAAAARRYETIGRWVGIAAVVAVALGMTARIYLQAWVDVEGAMPKTLPVAEANQSRITCPHCAGFGRVGVNGAYICPKCQGRKTVVSVAIVAPAAAPALDDMTIRQLKAQANAAKVPNYGRMTKPQLVEALAG